MATTRERARPLLGTIVRIAATGGDDAAIDAAFAEIERVHRRMSFQGSDSDLAAIARAAPGEAVAVDERTRACLGSALEWARRSGGAFDPVAAVDREATWRDLVPDDRGVTVRRRLRVDLSGIAKGFAVDRACDELERRGVGRAVVEAGGDLRVLGGRDEEVALRPSFEAEPALVCLADGSLASSDAPLARALAGVAVHVDGRDRRPVTDRFVAVAAPRCADADALAKIVLALGGEARPLLEGAAAVAYVHDGAGWTTMDGGA